MLLDLVSAFLGTAPIGAIPQMVVYVTASVLVIIIVDFVISCFRRLIGSYQ